MDLPRILWKASLVSPTVLAAALSVEMSAIATEIHSTTQADRTLDRSVAPMSATLPPTELEALTVTEIEAKLPPSLQDEESTVSNLALEPVRVAELPGGVSDATLLEQINRYSNETSSLNQVTNVSQLSDVSPGDWAFEALRSLVERYGCIAGYPDGTYRGNRALTRYEFAAGLNACLQQIESLIAGLDFVTREDLETLQRLVQEFEAELATLGTRVDNLEGRVAFLEDNQFSTTTKLVGESIFGLASVITGEDTDGDDLEEIPVLGNRTRLELETSFTGRDLLFTRLSAGNFPEFAEVTGTFEGELGFAQPEGNDVGLEVLIYSFPLLENTEVLLIATGGAADDFADTLNFLDGDGGSGAISAFGTRNPIYFPVEGAGIGIISSLGDSFELSLGYLAGEANDPSEGSGLADGPYSALAQVVFRPSDRFNIGLTYIHSYNQSDTGTGSNLANFRGFTDNLFGLEVPTVNDSFGLALSFQLSDRIIIGGWAGYTNTRTLSTLGGRIDRGELDIWNGAVTLAFPDLGKEGNLAGIIVGVEPKVTNSSIDIPGLVDILPAL
jgi:hypothetical protein